MENVRSNFDGTKLVWFGQFPILKFVFCGSYPEVFQTRAYVNMLHYFSISGGELFERVVADDFNLTERDCVIFLRQICEGVKYMHDNRVVHLDLKVSTFVFGNFGRQE